MTRFIIEWVDAEELVNKLCKTNMVDRVLSDWDKRANRGSGEWKKSGRSHLSHSLHQGVGKKALVFGLKNSP